MATLDVAIRTAAARGITDGAQALLTLDASGALVVIDFFAKAILDDHGYQVRAGTISVPLVGDVLITDTAAEFCVDIATGLVLIPVAQNISINLAGGTAHEYATKSVATASTAGAAFVPLPLNSGGPAAASTARVAAAGGVTVTAELATTTVFHWGVGRSAADLAVDGDWEPLRPPVLNGARCLYTQIAAATTGPSYFAHLDYLEFVAAQLGQ